ncbi:MAG: hypothetical protein GWN00_08645 [Aliifodinibius sp.]|nr:hypothetical protein [Fodinibius sp.]NIY24870.1 hypothetical protein [Fodinibius sp.]
MAVAFEVVYEVTDRDGDTATTTVKVPTGFSLAQYGEFGAAMATLLDAILGGRVSGADFCFIVDISGLTGNTQSPTSDVEEVAKFQFRTTEGRPVNVNIPTMDEAIVAGGTDDINQADPAVAPFIAAMENGLSTAGGTISPCDIGEDDIVLTVFAREGFRSRSRRR